MENFGKLNTAAFWMYCNGLIAEAGSPARRDLQESRRVMTNEDATRTNVLQWLSMSGHRQLMMINQFLTEWDLFVDRAGSN